MSNDCLGDRMKKNYEDRTRIKLPRRTYTLLRLDGKAFHNYTRSFRRPFDHILMGVLDRATIDLCMEISGAQFAYVQSDEVSVLITDFSKPETEAFFDGNLQKIVSVSASILTASFNEYMRRILPEFGYTNKAVFDCRVFTISDPTEVENYFIWRQNDWTRNSLQAVAQSLYSHKELHGKKHNDLHEMLFQKGVNWNNYSNEEKRGRVIRQRDFDTYWVADRDTPIFTQDRSYLEKLIPKME
jgi:tRNA(His) guanylyltransferase